MRRTQLYFDTYRVSVIALGTMAFIVLTAQGDFITWRSTAFFLVLAVAATFVPIQLPQGVLSVATALLVPVYLLNGVVMAAWVTICANIVGNGIGRKRPFATIMFNVGQLTLSILAGHAAFVAASGHLMDIQSLPSTTAFHQVLVPFMAFLLTYWVVNNALVIVYFMLRSGTPLQELLRQMLSWTVFNYVVGVVLGVIILFAYIDRGYGGAFIVFLPTVIFGYLMSLQLNLTRAHKELMTLYDAALQLNSAITMDDVFGLIHETILKTMPAGNVVLFLLDGDGETLTASHGVLENGDDLPDIHVKLGEGVIGSVAASLKPELVNGVEHDPRYQPSSGLWRLGASTGAMLLAPLIADGELVGILVAASSHDMKYERHQLRVFSILGNLVGVSIQNALLYERTERLAVTDELTGLYNYRYFRQRLADELRRARITGQSVALIYLDLDEFKQYNDRYGHAVGDELLKAFAGVLRGAVRNSDTPVRYAGDEFVVILPETERLNATLVEERIIDGVHQPFCTRQGLEVSLSVSAGIAVFPEDAQTADELTVRADQAMYARKASRQTAD